MAEVGSASVAIVPTFKGFRSQISSQADGAGKEAGGKFASGFKGLVGPAIAAAGAIGFSGLIAEAARASDATDKFKSTLNFAGLDTSAIDKATAASKAYADQTVYDLPTIQQTMAQLASNGVKDYTAITKAAGNLNAVAGGNAETFKSVSRSLTQSAGAGKLMTEDWNMLADAIPGASGVLQKSMKEAGAYTGNFKDAMAAGEITAQEFQDAITKLGNDPVAVNAAKSVTTFEGAIGNLQATINSGLTSALDALKPAITGAISGLAAGIGKVNGIIGGVFTLLKTGDFTGGIRKALGLEEDSKIVGAILAIRGGFVAMFAAFKAGGDDVTSSGFAGFMERIGLAARGAIDAVKNLFGAFKSGNGAAGVGDFFANIISGGAGLRDGLIKTVGEALPKVIGAIVAAAPTILNAAIGSFSSLVTAVIATVPPLLTAILGMLPSIITALLGMVPTLLTAGMQLFTGIVQALIRVVPQIVSTLVAILPQIAGSLLSMLPQIIDAGLSMFMGIVEAVVQLLPVLIDSVMTLLPAVVSTLLGMLPRIIDSALKLFLGVTTGILQALPTIINSLLRMLPALVSTLVGMIPQLVQAAVKLFTGIVRALPVVLPLIVDALIKIGPQLVSTILEMVPLLFGAGRALIQGFIDGIGAMVGAVGDAVGGLLEKAREFFPFSPAKRGPFSGKGYTSFSGKALAEDFAGGIDSQQSLVAKSASKLMSSASLSMNAGDVTASGRAGRGASIGGVIYNTTINQVDDPIGTSHAVTRRLQSLSA